MQCRYDNVRRLIIAELQNQFRQIGFVSSDVVARQKVVQADLGRGHRLDLDDLARLVLAQNSENDAVRLRRIRSPVHRAARRLESLFELEQIVVKVRQSVAPDRRAGIAQCLPVRLLFNQRRTFALDRVRGPRHIAA